MQSEIEFIRKEYKRQKKLEDIVNKRTLSTPKTKKWQVAIYFAILPFLLTISIVFITFLRLKAVYKVILIILLVLFIFETYLRFCLVQTVKCYQAYAKTETRRRCKCIPSCSEYAILSLKKVFPLILALLKIRERLFVTCNGEEYKVDFPLKKMGEKFESTL
ncbi:MAG: membrane protein insertion efficiency factor YidD [Clostridia bacterium]|nr:membrane protein insertion efficiency factor YidD [Clostridia bacterium]